MRYLFLLICIGACFCAKAQKSIQYSGSVEGGLLKGSKPASDFVFTTQGIAYKQYTFGVGSGFDFYPFRSVPLFIDVKRRFIDKNTQPFIQVAAGINFTSAKSNDVKWWYQNVEGKFNNGFFAKGGAGIIFRARHRLKFSLSAGYTYKTSVYAYKTFDGDRWEGQTQLLSDNYHFNRWYMGAGIIW